MTLQVADRVKETTTTTGTGAITLGGAETGYQSFTNAITTGATTYYCVQNSSTGEWEVGLGTLTAPTTLARTTVLASSNSGSLVNFAAGTKDAFVTLPARIAGQDVGTNNFRLTATTVTPITTNDVTGATTVYVTPYKGSKVGLYDGSSWALYSSAELSLSVATNMATVGSTFTGTTTNGSPVVTGITSTTGLYAGQPISCSSGFVPSGYIKSVDSSTQITMSVNAGANITPTFTVYQLCYDVFLYLSSGVPTVQVVAWASTTTRATALVLQDGILSKSGDTTKRYIGTYAATSSTTTEDSVTNRYIWNQYNQVPRKLFVTDTSTNWTYSTAAWRAWHGSSSHSVNVVIGQQTTWVELESVGCCNSGASQNGYNSIEYDSSTTNTTASLWTFSSSLNVRIVMTAKLAHYPAIGKHTYYLIEQASGATCTFSGTADVVGVGMVGSIMA